MILPCVIVFGCAFASLALLTPHLWHLYAIFAILGAVGNGTAHLAYTRAVSTWFDRHRGMALALVMTGGAVGAIVLPPVGASADPGAWAGAGRSRVLGALVFAVGLPVVVPLVREKPGVDRERRVETEGASVAQAMRSRAFWILIVVLFLFSIGQNGAHDASLGVADGSRCLAAATRPWRFPLLGAASLLGRLVTGWLLDRFFAPRLAFCVLALGALGIFILSSAHSLAMGSLAAILVGGAMGGEADITPYILSRYFGLQVILDALRVYVDGVRHRRCDRSGLDGQGLRHDRILSGAGGEAFRPHALRGGAHVSDAGVRRQAVFYRPVQTGASHAIGLAGSAPGASPPPAVQTRTKKYRAVESSIVGVQ